VSLEEILAVRRWDIRPGDCLVIQTDVADLSRQQAEEIRRKVRVAAGVQVPVLVLPRGWEASVVSDQAVPFEDL